MNDLRYRIKYLLNLGEIQTPNGLERVDQFQIRPGIFKGVDQAVKALFQLLKENRSIEFAHIQINGKITGGSWVRVVYAKQGMDHLEPCIGLRDDIWELFASYGKKIEMKEEIA